MRKNWVSFIGGVDKMNFSTVHWNLVKQAVFPSHTFRYSRNNKHIWSLFMIFQ